MKDISGIDWKSLINYDPETGEATWINRVSPTVPAGAKVGSMSQNGYIKFMYKRNMYLLHRVVFFMETGIQPPEVDHINLCKTDNSISNLRASSRRQNEYNKSANKASSTGVKGVTLSDEGNYRARVKKDGVRINLGTFKTIDEAAAALSKFRREHHGDFARD